MGTINWNLTADEEKFLRSCLNASNALKQVGTAGEAAGRKSRSAFSAVTDQAKSFAVAVTGIGSATAALMAVVAKVREEIEHVRAQQRRAGETQVTAGEARARAILNKPASVEAAWLDQLVTATAKTEKVDQARLWGLASQMLSSKGNLSNQQFAAAFRESARVGALAGPELDLPTLGGGIQDVMRVTGLTDPRAAGGWIRQIGQQARVVDLDKQIRSVVPPISTARAYGWTEQQAAQFMAYLTMFSGDTQGRRSSSGAVGFMEQVDSARTKAGAIIPTTTTWGKAGFRPLKAKGFGAIAELQEWYASAPESDREIFRDKLAGEKRTKGGILSLIARDPAALAAFATIQGNITDPRAAGVTGAWESYFADTARGPVEGTRAAKRTIEAATEAQNMRNPSAAVRMARDKYAEFLGATPGVSATSIWSTGLDIAAASWGGLNPMDALIEDAERRQRQRLPFRRMTGSPFAPTARPTFTYYDTQRPGLGMEPNPAANAEQAGAFRDLIVELKGLRDDMARQRDGTGKPAAVAIVEDRRVPATQPAAQVEGN